MKSLLNQICSCFISIAFLIVCSSAHAVNRNISDNLTQKETIITTPYSAEEFYGNYVILAFVSFYCTDCLKTVLTLNDIYNKLTGLKINGVEVKVAPVYIDETIDENEITEFAEEKNITCPLYINNSDIYKGFNIVFLPTIFLIDTTGGVAKKYIGYKKEKVIEKDLFEIMKNN